MNNTGKIYEVRGVRGKISELSEYFDVPRGTVYDRMIRQGKTAEEAIEEGIKLREKTRIDPENITLEKLNIQGCHHLAAAVIGLAYEDLANAEVLRILRDDPNYSKRIIERKERIIRRAEKWADTELKNREHTDEQVEKYTERKILEIMRTIESRGESAERFLLSDRMLIFSRQIDGRFVVEKARARARDWADGKTSSYHLKGQK